MTPVPSALRPFDTVFLDRDGTINVKAPEDDYITTPDDLILLPGAGKAIRALNQAGFMVVVVTNQRGVALGRLSTRRLDLVHRRLRSLLAANGARIDAIYSCPHDLGACRCRKPLPGLLQQAQVDMPKIDLRRAVTIGDSEADVRAGQAAATATVRLGPTDVLTEADFHCSDLVEATDLILHDSHVIHLCP